jgi:hypothetical protein
LGSGHPERARTPSASGAVAEHTQKFILGASKSRVTIGTPSGAGRTQSSAWKGVTSGWVLFGEGLGRLQLFPITDKQQVILKTNKKYNRLKLQFHRYILGNIGPVGC